jgi:HK97 family phage major capsid protein
MSKDEARAEKARCIEEAQRINSANADPETGLLSAEAQKQFDTLVYRARVCDGHIATAGFQGNSHQNGTAAFVNVKTGETVHALAHGDHLSAGNVGRNSQWQLGGGNTNRLSVGETIRQLVTGEGGSPEFSANITGSDTGGGYLGSEIFSRDVLDLARSASVVSRAGARTIPLDTNALHMARLTQDVTAHWRGETAPIPSSEVAFNRISLKPRVVAALTTLSVELLEDASNAAEVIENSITNALGLALDYAALFGTGAEEQPQGLFNVSGVNAETSVGTPDDYAKVTSAVRQILTANYAGDVPALAWLGHPRDFATYDGLTDTTGQPLRPTPWASQLRPLSSTSFPIETGATSMIVGDFSQVLIGMRTSGVRIEMFRSGTTTDVGGTSRNAVSEMMVHIRAYMRADVAVMRPSWFTKLTGVTAA